MNMRKTAICAAMALGLAACESGSGVSGSTVGTLGGAAAGGLLGSQFGGGTGKLAATAVGTLLGALAGREAGRRLTENDGNRAATAERRALAQNETISWNNPESGTRGTIDPQRTYTNANGQLCRDYTHTIFVDGRAEQATGTACRQSDGNWRLVS